MIESWGINGRGIAVTERTERRRKSRGQRKRGGREIRRKWGSRAHPSHMIGPPKNGRFFELIPLLLTVAGFRPCTVPWVATCSVLTALGMRHVRRHVRYTLDPSPFQHVGVSCDAKLLPCEQWKLRSSNDRGCYTC
jgi:hypothetical protein